MECYYSIHLDYPISDDQYLCIAVDVEKRLLSKELTLPVFIELQNIVCRKGYMVNSAYVHYNSGNSSRMILEGCAVKKSSAGGESELCKKVTLNVS